jgi:hypothetical protein
MQENNSEQYVFDNIILLTSYIHRIMRSVHYYKKCHQSISLLQKRECETILPECEHGCYDEKNFGEKFSTASGER